VISHHHHHFFLNVFSALKATLPYFFKNGLEARLWINNGRLIPLVGHLLPVCSRFVFYYLYIKVMQQLKCRRTSQQETTVTSALHLPSTPLRACVSFISHAFKSPPLSVSSNRRARSPIVEIKGRPFFSLPFPMSNLLIISPYRKKKKFSF